jgi:hypothetical protein
MRKIAAAGIITLILTLGSCAGITYSRNWAVNNADLTDTLTISDEKFVLERIGSGGVSAWEGVFKENGDTWVFEIKVWRPSNASAKSFDPPIRYIYQMKKFQNGVSFLQLVEVVGHSNFQFIQAGDYQLK